MPVKTQCESQHNISCACAEESEPSLLTIFVQATLGHTNSGMKWPDPTFPTSFIHLVKSP